MQLFSRYGHLVKEVGRYFLIAIAATTWTSADAQGAPAKTQPEADLLNWAQARWGVTDIKYVSPSEIWAAVNDSIKMGDGRASVDVMTFCLGLKYFHYFPTVTAVDVTLFSHNSKFGSARRLRSRLTPALIETGGNQGYCETGLGGE